MRNLIQRDEQPDRIDRPDPNAKLIGLARIRRNPRNPRQMIDDEDFRDLVQSIEKNGILQPILVRPLGDGNYELVAGERRWAATREAGRDAIPCLVRPMDDITALKYCLQENLLKRDLDPAELYVGLEGLSEHFPKLRDLAEQVGRSPDWLSNKLGPLRSELLQERVLSGRISMTAAEEVDRAPEEIQEPLARVATGKIGKEQLRDLRQLYVSAPEEKKPFVADRIERLGFVPIAGGKRLSAIKTIIREGIPDIGQANGAFGLRPQGESAESPSRANAPRSLPGTIAVLRGIVVQVIHAEDATEDERAEVERLAEKLVAWANR